MRGNTTKGAEIEESKPWVSEEKKKSETKSKWIQEKKKVLQKGRGRAFGAIAAEEEANVQDDKERRENLRRGHPQCLGLLVIL